MKIKITELYWDDSIPKLLAVTFMHCSYDIHISDDDVYLSIQPLANFAEEVFGMRFSSCEKAQAYALEHINKYLALSLADCAFSVEPEYED